ncbi:MAG: hypothetical protein ACREXP_08080 [Steroidobacteraceae bacterium]
MRLASSGMTYDAALPPATARFSCLMKSTIDVAAPTPGSDRVLLQTIHPAQRCWLQNACVAVGLDHDVEVVGAGERAIDLAVGNVQRLALVEVLDARVVDAHECRRQQCDCA